MLDAVQTPAHLARHLLKRVPFQMMENKYFTIIGRQTVQRVGQQHGVFAAHSPLTRCTLCRNQLIAERAGRIGQLIRQALLQSHISALSSKVSAKQVSNQSSQYLPKPTCHFCFSHSAKSLKVPMSFQERVLNQISRIDFPTKPCCDL